VLELFSYSVSDIHQYSLLKRVTLHTLPHTALPLIQWLTMLEVAWPCTLYTVLCLLPWVHLACSVVVMLYIKLPLSICAFPPCATPVLAVWRSSGDIPSLLVPCNFQRYLVIWWVVTYLYHIYTVRAPTARPNLKQ